MDTSKFSAAAKSYNELPEHREMHKTPYFYQMHVTLGSHDVDAWSSLKFLFQEQFYFTGTILFS